MMGRRGRRGSYNIHLLAISLIVVGIILYYMPQFGLDLDVAEYFRYCWPGLMLLLFSIYGLTRATGQTRIIAFIMVGIAFALLSGELNTGGILIPSLLTPDITIERLQLGIVVLSGVIGIIFSL